MSLLLPPLQKWKSRTAGQDEREGVEKCSPYGLRFCSQQKLGDVFLTSEFMAFQEFKVLYDIRNRVRSEYGLDWDSF